MIKFKNETPIRVKHVLLAFIVVLTLGIIWKQQNEIDSLKNRFEVCRVSYEHSVETYNNILEHYLTSEQLTELRKASNE